MNNDQARTNMIKQQIRTWDVSDQKVLDVMSTVPRELFVPKAFRNLAYADTAISLGHDELILAPNVQARALQSLSISADDQVLEIGTGSGYLTALLSMLGREVLSVEIYNEFADNARARLKESHIKNTTVETGNAASGWQADQRFDVIVICSSMYRVPEHFLQQLSDGGRLFTIVGSAPAMQATLITRVSEKEWETKALFETVAPSLIDGIQAEKFQF